MNNFNFISLINHVWLIVTTICHPCRRSLTLGAGGNPGIETVKRSVSTFILTVTLIVFTGSNEIYSQISPEFSSNLPIIIIHTDGRSIPDEPKIDARMEVIFNGLGETNAISDANRHYDGLIGIERRGSSTQQFEKKSYSLETRMEDGENNNVKLLDLPRENDWILYAPYGDKTLIRNALIFHLSNEVGMYAPRTRFCEVFLNDDYRGVYVLMEKIKRDDDRVDIARLTSEDIEGDALTGGYLMRIDWPDNGEGWYTTYAEGGDYGYGEAKIMHADPKWDELEPVQRNYIKDYVTEFEEALKKQNFADPLDGYRNFIDIESFYRYFIFQELANNVDAYSLSTFFYKDRDSREGKLTMGPLWDFNHSLGNCDYGGSHSTSTFSFDTYLDPAPKWWRRLLADTAFVQGLSDSWSQKRQTVLTRTHIIAIIDSFATELDQAQERNFERWEILGEYVWPNYFVGDTYEEELAYMKNWVGKRLLWLDDAFPSISFEEEPGGTPQLNFNKPEVKTGPNPFISVTNFIFYVPFEHQVIITLYDVLGQEILQLVNNYFPEGTHMIPWDGKNKNGINVSNGVYFYIFEFNYETVSVNKMIKF